MKILLFGSTGSIGTQTIKVIKKMNFSLVGISFFNNEILAKKIIKENKIKFYFSPINLKASSVNSYQKLIDKTKPDLIVNAITGFAGLEITLLAINNKVDIALANKESLVVAGKFVTQLAKKNKVNIYPIDSEHSAIYQALIYKKEFLKTIYITASGGPFYNRKNLLNITYEQAVKHPNWAMGEKISIDSATMVNKCFEIIEAYWLFNTKNIIPIYHPQSIVHSMVEFKDNSIVAIMSKTDMQLPIQLALNKYNNNKICTISRLSFDKLNLNFDILSKNKFIPIKWAKKVIDNPNTNLPIIINAANEEAINLFKQKKIKFMDIVKIVDKLINNIKIIRINNISQIYIIDSLTRKIILNQYK